MTQDVFHAGQVLKAPSSHPFMAEQSYTVLSHAYVVDPEQGSVLPGTYHVIVKAGKVSSQGPF